MIITRVDSSGTGSSSQESEAEFHYGGCCVFVETAGVEMI